MKVAIDVGSSELKTKKEQGRYLRLTLEVSWFIRKTMMYNSLVPDEGELSTFLCAKGDKNHMDRA